MNVGKGLSSIFGADVSQMLEDIQSGVHSDHKPIEIPLSQIWPNRYQPRRTFDEVALQELANSIREHGVFTPILVKKSNQGYELIAGERRVRASRLADLTKIPAIIVDFDDQQMMEISLLENIQREDLNVIEEAKAYEQLIKTFHYTQEQLATRVSKSREHIANLLRLLKLPDDVSQMVVDKKLSMGHVRALLALKDASSMQRLARLAYEQGWSVRMMEQKVRECPEKKKSSEKATQTELVKGAVKQLEDFFQAPVRIRPTSISIHYETPEDLNRILERLIHENEFHYR